MGPGKLKSRYLSTSTTGYVDHTAHLVEVLLTHNTTILLLVWTWDL